MGRGEAELDILYVREKVPRIRLEYDKYENGNESVSALFTL